MFELYAANTTLFPMKRLTLLCPITSLEKPQNRGSYYRKILKMPTNRSPGGLRTEVPSSRGLGFNLPACQVLA